MTTPLLDTETREAGAVVSPDGAWVAYASGELGGNEVLGAELIMPQLCYARPQRDNALQCDPDSEGVRPPDRSGDEMTSGKVHYKRSRFSTRLLEDRLYTAGHSWLEREEGDLWRVGFTKFATRMLGEIVELGFEMNPGSPVETGQVIGWLEGFKAVTDIFSPLSGRFEGYNPALDKNITLLTTEPYTRGWLFKVQGQPDTESLDVHGYVSLLDTTIDKMLGRRRE